MKNSKSVKTERARTPAWHIADYYFCCQKEFYISAYVYNMEADCLYCDKNQKPLGSACSCCRNESVVQEKMALPAWETGSLANTSGYVN